MGSCVSGNKEMASPVKIRFPIESKNETVLIPSPVNERTDAVDGGDRTAADVTPKPQLSPARFGHAGSKDEAFFDSQPWLESDCEDDFLSVNGDFTPSRGSTPVHRNFYLVNPQPGNTCLTERITMGPTFPTSKKKRLSDLFKDSLHDNELPYEENTPDGHLNGDHARVVPDESMGLAGSDRPTYISRPKCRTSSQMTRDFGGSEKEEQVLRSKQCCLPRLWSSRGERKGRALLGKLGDGWLWFWCPSVSC